MGRMKNVDGVDMPLTAEEEAQRDKRKLNGKLVKLGERWLRSDSTEILYSEKQIILD